MLHIRVDEKLKVDKNESPRTLKDPNRRYITCS